MCGIIGIFNRKNAGKLVKEGLSSMQYRGKDGFGIASESREQFSKQLNELSLESDTMLGHALHSVVSFVPQPLIGKGRFVSNCEVYNWKELDKKYDLHARNDSEVLFKLIEKRGDAKLPTILKEIDGVFAFAYWIGNIIYLTRDILGEKPVWYSHTQGFGFASEKKTLEKLGYYDIYELNPRMIISYDLKNDKLMFIPMDFFTITPEHKQDFGVLKEMLKKKLIAAVGKRIPNKPFGILFSGGIDSVLLSVICKQMNKQFTCYTAVLDEPGMTEAEDLIFARKVSEKLGLRLEIIKIKLKDVENYLKVVVPLIEDSNVVKVGVALTFFVACERAKKDNIKVIFSGLGSEEIFGGYQRHRQSQNVNKECLSGLIKMYERDLYRDDVVTMYHNLELRTPFLDKGLVEFALKIPEKYKITKDYGKYILRKVAEELGLDKEFAWRKKRAAQYGSKFDRALQKLTKKSGLRYRSEYLRQFYPSHNVRLGALVSSGKDSMYATYVMKSQNYEIVCLIAMVSKNPYSYMFHTPTIDLVKLQASAMRVPLVEQATMGDKEEELGDLHKALEKAKKEYKIEGVITGALYSNYQRDRIEKICDKLGLKIFSPLWHINQETEMRELIDNGFKVVISSVACEGLDWTWVGKEITYEVIDRLVKLNEKVGMNIAFEGGEAESLVIDCPLFHEKLHIEYDIQEESESIARMIVKKALLVKK